MVLGSATRLFAACAVAACLLAADTTSAPAGDAALGPMVVYVYKVGWWANGPTTQAIGRVVLRPSPLTAQKTRIFINIPDVGALPDSESWGVVLRGGTCTRHDRGVSLILNELRPAEGGRRAQLESLVAIPMAKFRKGDFALDMHRSRTDNDVSLQDVIVACANL